MNTDTKACAGCSLETEMLNELTAVEYLKHISGWMILEKAGTPQLTKSYAFKDFAKALLFTNQIGDLAEVENHHPAILVEWGNVTVYWWTHRLQGLTKLDFEMAATCDLLFEE